MKKYNRLNAAVAARDSAPVNSRSGGKARRIQVHYGGAGVADDGSFGGELSGGESNLLVHVPLPPADGGNFSSSSTANAAEGLNRRPTNNAASPPTMVVVAGTKRPYPDWQNQHGPTGASAEGITEAEAEAMVMLTARILSTNFGGGTSALEKMMKRDSDDSSFDDDDNETIGEFKLRITEATVVGDSDQLQQQHQLIKKKGRERGSSQSSRQSGSGPRRTPRGSRRGGAPQLTAAERAAKVAEEMEARADADESREFGFLYQAQQQEAAMRQQQQQQRLASSNGGKGGVVGISPLSSRLATPLTPGDGFSSGSGSHRRGFGAHTNGRPSSSSLGGDHYNNNNSNGDANKNNGEEINDGEEVIQFDVTTPGGLAAHILATGGYGCPDPSKPYPAVPKHHSLAFEEDIERGATTPTRRHVHVGATTGIGANGGDDDDGSGGATRTRALGVGLGAIAVTQHHPHVTYSPLRAGRSIGADRPMSPMAALRAATGSANATGYWDLIGGVGIGGVSAKAIGGGWTVAGGGPLRPPSASARDAGGGGAARGPLSFTSGGVSPATANAPLPAFGGGGGGGNGSSSSNAHLLVLPPSRGGGGTSSHPPPGSGRAHHLAPLRPQTAESASGGAAGGRIGGPSVTRLNTSYTFGDGASYGANGGGHATAPPPIRRMRISEVAMSRQPWAFQDAVLDAQILQDAKMNATNIKTGVADDDDEDDLEEYGSHMPWDRNGEEAGDWERRDEGSLSSPNRLRLATAAKPRYFVSTMTRAEKHRIHLSNLARAAGRNPKATMLLPRSSSDAAYGAATDDDASGPASFLDSTQSGVGQHEGVPHRRLYDSSNGAVPMGVLAAAYAHDEALRGGQQQQRRTNANGGRPSSAALSIDIGAASGVGAPPNELLTARGVGGGQDSGSGHATRVHSSSFNHAGYSPTTPTTSGYGGSGGISMEESSAAMAAVAAGSPFMKQKQLIGERILANTFQSVAERERRNKPSSAQRRRQDAASAAAAHTSSSSSAVASLAQTPMPQGATSSSGEFANATLSEFTASLLNNAPGSVIGKGIVMRGRRGSAATATLPPTSMTSRDVFIAQQRLLNANLRDLYATNSGEGNGEGEGAGGVQSAEAALVVVEPEDLPDDDSEAALSKQYDHLLPFLAMENKIETRRFLCELWAKHVALASSLDAFSLMVAKNRARHTLRHVAIPMVMRWIKQYRRNLALKKEISARMDEVVVKRPNSAVLRQNNRCLADWSDAMIDQLMLSARFIPFRQGQFVCWQGEPTKAIYLVVSGEVEVIVMDRSASDKRKIKSRRAENGKVVANLGPGRMFGEIASVTSQPRCASVRCVTDCDLLCLTHTDFARAGSSLPERSWQLLRQQSQQMRVQNIGTVFPLSTDDVQRHSMFAHWGHSAALGLVEQFVPIFIPQGEYLFMPPMINENACAIIRSGTVKATPIDAEGNVDPSEAPTFYGPGDIVGERETVMIVRRGFNAVCETAVEAYLLSRGGYVSAAAQNATFAARSREIVAGRIAAAWTRPPAPKAYLADPILSYLVSEEVLLALWELATPRLIWQSELMLLAGQPCDAISVVVRGTFHERAATTRAASASAGRGMAAAMSRSNYSHSISRTQTPVANGSGGLTFEGGEGSTPDAFNATAGSATHLNGSATLAAASALAQSSSTSASTPAPAAWSNVTDAAFLPPHLKRLEQRATHRQYEDGLDGGDAVIFGPLEIGVSHPFYLRTVWCTGSCHVWQIPRSAFEALVKREHPRVWEAIKAPKTLEAILENAENLSRLANDSNPPRRAGI